MVVIYKTSYSTCSYEALYGIKAPVYEYWYCYARMRTALDYENYFPTLPPFE